jgi:hypothetical protein
MHPNQPHAYQEPTTSHARQNVALFYICTKPQTCSMEFYLRWTSSRPTAETYTLSRVVGLVRFLELLFNSPFFFFWFSIQPPNSFATSHNFDPIFCVDSILQFEPASSQRRLNSILSHESRQLLLHHEASPDLLVSNQLGFSC